MLRQLRNRLEQKKGERNRILGEIEILEQRIAENTIKLKRHEEAREIIRAVGLETQQQLQYHIGDITSLALETVYKEPYQLVAEFVQRRNRTECDLYFMRGGNRYNPLDDSGGGVVNVASFALRVASWSMQNPHSRNVLLLDEPFVNVAEDLLPRVGEMIQQISKRLRLQIIMGTHSEDLISAADRVFHIYLRDEVSVIEEE